MSVTTGYICSDINEVGTVILCIYVILWVDYAKIMLIFSIISLCENTGMYCIYYLLFMVQAKVKRSLLTVDYHVTCYTVLTACNTEENIKSPCP